MKKYGIAILIVAAVVAAGYGIWWITKPSMPVDAARATGRANGAPVPVKIMLVTSEPVPVQMEAVGMVEPEQSVAIRAQVGGTLQKVFFQEGDYVKAGQLLFQIDASTLQADLENARANLARDQATLAQATAQERRLAPLVAKEYITRDEYDKAAAQQKSGSAVTQAGRAQLRAAEIQLERTRLRAPISGRVGSLAIKQGNLVNANGADPLVVINSTQPIMVSFNVPQQKLQDIRDRPRDAMTVEISREMNSAVVATGRLTFINNSVDPANGTIKLKARIPNENEAIWPGELVSVRLILGIQENAIVVPESAVQAGQTGPFVYLVENSHARMQTITVARQVGSKIVVARGLKAGDPVIVNAPSSLRPGSAVRPMEQDATAKGDNRPPGTQRRQRHKDAATPSAASGTDR